LPDWGQDDTDDNEESSIMDPDEDSMLTAASSTLKDTTDQPAATHDSRLFCKHCGLTFSRRDALMRHIASKHARKRQHDEEDMPSTKK
jgi:hypothetical protein